MQMTQLIAVCALAGIFCFQNLFIKKIESTEIKTFAAYWKLLRGIWSSTTNRKFSIPNQDRNNGDFIIYPDSCSLVYTNKTSGCNLVTEFIIPQYINSSTCFERYVAHHQAPQLYLQLLVYIRLWRPPVVPSEWELA